MIQYLVFNAIYELVEKLMIEKLLCNHVCDTKSKKSIK